jgi:hypothetical protein
MWRGKFPLVFFGKTFGMVYICGVKTFGMVQDLHFKNLGMVQI